MNQIDARLIPKLVDRFGALRRSVDTALKALIATPIDQQSFIDAQSLAIAILREITAMQDAEVRNDDSVAGRAPP